MSYIVPTVKVMNKELDNMYKFNAQMHAHTLNRLESPTLNVIRNACNEEIRIKQQRQQQRKQKKQQAT